MPKNFTRYSSGEWSALYEDGKLAIVGDHYLSQEYLEEELGVNVLYNEDFLMSDRRTAYSTLEEVEEATKLRESREERASELRQRANALIEEAERLERNA